MKETYFFTHDFNARNDPKLVDVLRNHGQAGIGTYWGLIEMIYEQGGELTLDKIESIAFQLHIGPDIVKSLVLDFGLFDNDGKVFWSESVKRRLQKRAEIADKRRSAANNRWKGEAGRNSGRNEASGANGQQQEESPGKMPPKGPDVDFKAIVDMFHSICKSFPRVARLSDTRKNKIRIRFDEMGRNMDTLRTIFEKMEASKFMQGDNPRGWKAFFDWVFENETNWCKIIEGNYDNKVGKSGTKGDNSSVNDEWK